MVRFAGSIVQYPARAAFWWYAAAVLAGTLALGHPAARAAASQPIAWIDAVFTATSAVCVTGLVVVSTGHDFSLFGQIVVLILIQIGGIGIMTITTYATFGLGGMANLRQRAVVNQSLGSGGDADLGWVLRNVIKLSLLCEAAGFLVLASRNLLDMPVPQALWHALFHAVSAFCNAGFALYDDSLVGYRGDTVVNSTVMLLIVCGGIGFPVWLDLLRNLHGTPAEIWHRLALHSKMMLLGTALLIAIGTGAFLALEWEGVLAGLPLWEKLLVAKFQAVTCRTAGFNTVEIAALNNASLFVLMLLMMIGGGPCSAAGGFKVTTFLILLLRGWATVWGSRQVSLFGRTIKRDAIDRATTTALLFAAVLICGLTLLLVIEQREPAHHRSQGMFLEACFEIVSALGTVGLSAGLTEKLTLYGKLIVIVLMFVGRLGPISIGLALSRESRETRLDYPYEEPLTG